MTTNRRKIQEKARETAAPIIAEIGLEIIDVEYVRRGKSRILTFYLDRRGGISVDDLQQASRSIEKILEVSEVVEGPYRLEVSSPGIDRPLRSRADFVKSIGSAVSIKLFQAHAGGQRNLRGVIVAVEDDNVILRCSGENADISVALENIARARPEIDWQALLKGSSSASAEADPARRSS